MYYDIVKSGERIKELRKVAGITRQSLAEKAGISVDALRKIEQGINGAKIDTLVAIAEIFHVSLDYLTQTSHIKNGTCSLKNQYFSS